MDMNFVKSTLGWTVVIAGIVIIIWLPLLPAILFWIFILIIYALSFKLG